MKQLANEPDFYSCEVDDILAKGRNKYLKRIKKNKNRLQGHLSPWFPFRPSNFVFLMCHLSYWGIFEPAHSIFLKFWVSILLLKQRVAEEPVFRFLPKIIVCWKSSLRFVFIFRGLTPLRRQITWFFYRFKYDSEITQVQGHLSP